MTFEGLLGVRARLETALKRTVDKIRAQCNHVGLRSRVVMQHYNEYEPDQYELYCPTCGTVNP